MFRWYCWLIFFGVVILSSWAFPADGDGDETNLVVVGNGNEENEDVAVENRALSEEDEDDDDDDDDDDEGIIEDGTLDVTDRHFQKGKPQKQKKDKDKKDSKEDKDEKDSKKKKCICFGKKHKHYHSGHGSYNKGNDRVKSS
jgi:hypothetical protein